MFTKITEFTASNPNVRKYIFEKEDVCVEAVLYKYDSYFKRTVLCVSTQCGCPVGCTFCGTGKQFIRNLTAKEIADQVLHIISSIESELQITSLNSACEKFQIMFMSMGEPMLNWDNVDGAIRLLKRTYPNAQLLLSTMGVNNNETFKQICNTSKMISNVGLQFSVHSGYDSKRDIIIPFKNKMNLRQIRDNGIMWHQTTGRPVYLNFCVDESNMTFHETNRIKNMFSPLIFNITFSVICDNKEGTIQDIYTHCIIEDKITKLMGDFINDGYNVRMFDPSGQEIGGGCGQLFYVQNWMNERKQKER